MIISVFDRAKNIVGKGEIACTSNFSFSQNIFKRLLSQTRQKVSLCGNGLKTFFVSVQMYDNLIGGWGTGLQSVLWQITANLRESSGET